MLGGSQSVFKDLDAALAMFAGSQVALFVCNDMIAEFPGPAVAVSLHPPKTSRWLKIRCERGFPAPEVVWSDRPLSAAESVGVVEEVRAYPNYDAAAGSVGFFATRIAQQTCSAVILCGVPMDPTANHFLRKKPWPSAIGFRAAWLRNRHKLGNVRSCSGWTADLLGKPTAEWLSGVLGTQSPIPAEEAAAVRAG